jgi:hypothetical protein
MVPPLMSSTMSGADLLDIKSQKNTTKSQTTSEGQSGRPEKPDD